MKDFSLEEGESGFDWAENFHTWLFRGKVLLKKYWWVFLLTVSLGIGYQAYKELQRKPLFRSSARMIVSGRIATPDSSVYREELSNFFGTEIQLMQSPRVQQGARDRVQALKPELKPVPVMVRAAQQPATSIFILTGEGGEPQYTRAFLDACLEEYINFKKETRSATSESTLLAINEQLLVLEDEIEKGENAMVEFQKKNNLVFIQEQGTTAGSYLARLKNRMAALESQYRELESLSLDQHLEEADTAEGNEDIVRVSILEASENYKRAKGQYDQLVAQLDETSHYLKPRHPKIINLKLEIERAENLLQIYRKQGLEQLEEKKNVLETRIKNLEAEITEWEGTSLNYSRLLAEYNRLKSQQDRNKSLYQRLLDSIQSIDLNLNLDQETVAILENASPAYPIMPEIGKRVAEGGMAGLVLGGGLIFLLGLLDNRIVSGDDLTRRFDQPVMGIIPFQSSAKNGRMELLQPKDERHLFAEACRTLRSSLLFMGEEGNQPRTFIVTSAVPSEGKSTLSGNLAITLAFTASRTLLADADLRRGQLHKALKLKNDRGISELIQNNLPLEAVIQKTGFENLDFISCGTYPERPGELLLGSRMDEILKELKDRYDYIIFDSAPVLATDDTTSFATKVDAVLFTVRSSFTQARQVKSSLERLKLLGVNVCGFILNCVDTKGADYYYYNKYQNYYYVEKGRGPLGKKPS